MYFSNTEKCNLCTRRLFIELHW